MTSTLIRHIHARQVLDSRGHPTVEADAVLADGSIGRGVTPSGASTGTAEAHELRDGDPTHYEGRGVLRAVQHVNGEIARALADRDALDQWGVDRRLRELDGTPQLKRLGANAILAVSMAVCRAAAASKGKPLYKHLAELSGTNAPTIPVPMVNILSGGLHAGRGMDVQDFLAVPVRARSIEEAIRLIARVRSAATAVLAERGMATLLADEGGLSPGLETSTAALKLMNAAFERAGLMPGEDVVIAMDVAATSLMGPDGYELRRECRTVTSAEMIAMQEKWVSEFPVVSIEDGLGEDDWGGWKQLSTQLAGRIQLIGDDLFATSPLRLAMGIEQGIANAVLVKPNQNGTVSGSLDVIAQARAAGYAQVISARSGETEDSFIADLAVGTAAGQIKIGSLRNSERLAKYNQLLRIEEESRAPYLGICALSSWKR